MNPFVVTSFSLVSSEPDETGEKEFKHHFRPISKVNYVPEGDVVIECTNFLKLLLKLILDCYKVFGEDIDPELFFTYENMLKRKKSIEDFEVRQDIPEEKQLSRVLR